MPPQPVLAVPCDAARPPRPAFCTPDPGELARAITKALRQPHAAGGAGVNRTATLTGIAPANYPGPEPDAIAGPRREDTLPKRCIPLAAPTWLTGCRRASRLAGSSKLRSWVRFGW